MNDLGTTRTDRTTGLGSAEAGRRLAQFGANEVAQAKVHPLAALADKFWGPIPWMLELTIALQLLLGKHVEAAVIGGLLAFNAILSFVQEARANEALALLRRRLSVQARALRDGQWRSLPARELVPGDIVHLRMGDLAPADIRLFEGALLLDQSSLTGEALPVEAGADGTAYAGTTIRRGEATGEVTATGARTRFGKASELVRTARAVSHLQRTIFAIVKTLALFDATLVALLLVYAWLAGVPATEALPFALILLVASVPVALPATFTLATALGATELARDGVLVTRLSAIEEAAGMDVLCCDKTGTITRNELRVAALVAYAPCEEDELLRLAAVASDPATQDPIDLAILEHARAADVLRDLPARESAIPFDPAHKYAETGFSEAGRRLRVLKGAPQILALLASAPPSFAADMTRLAAGGRRVLAVASGTGSVLRLAGLLALADPPRENSRAVIEGLKALGLRIIMATGDTVATARAVATAVGLGSRAAGPEALQGSGPDGIEDFDVFGGVYPEDKFRIIRRLQERGHVVGMTGDGVNDAPALRQAEIGIAVANATDVAKAAGGLVLTNPGLGDMLAAVRSSREIYQRMLTYTLNKIVKTLEIAVFLSLGFILTGVFVVTPLLIVLLLFANDFVSMSLATDRAVASPKPDRWHIRTLMLAGSALALANLGLSFAVFFWAHDLLRLPLDQCQTIVFLLLVATGQGNVYLVRERGHFWRSRPSGWLLLSSIADLVAVALMATNGILMAAVAPRLVLELALLVLLFLMILDSLKLRLFRLLAVR